MGFVSLIVKDGNWRGILFSRKTFL